MTGLDVQASFGITLGDLEKWGDGVVNRLKEPEPEPFYTTRSASAVQGTTPAVITLDLGSPPTGSIWQIRWVTTFGWDAFTSVNVSVGPPVVPLFGALFTGDPFNLSLAGLLLGALTIPITRFVPDTVMWCHPNQNLIAQFGYITEPSGTPFLVPAGQQVGLNVGIEEWKERDVSRKAGY
jgi:hypothetical protein